MSTDIFSLRLGINSSYLIRGVKGIIMVDAGTPNKIRSFKRKLSRLYIRPQEIKLIVLTHSHFDHAGSAKEIQELTGAKIVIHESEKTFLEEGGFIMPQGVNTYGKITKQLLFPFFKKIPFPKPKADIVLGDNDLPLYEYGVDGKIIHTPGHTHGSISILLDTGEAFVGCLAHNGLPFRVTPGLPIYAENINQVYESWKKLIARGARVVFPGHGRPFSVEIIKRQLK
jgi:glyoxylase-like metal-dependent hydrolase (beta-lactamase superfamily II)